MTTSVSLFISYIKTIGSLLWRSVSSVDFYREVYNNYRGYGIKYIFTLCLFVSFFYTISLMYNISEVEGALVSGDNKEFEHILTQIPEIRYNGSEISTEVEMPYFINDLENRKVAVVDLNGELAFNERVKIPVVLTKNNMLIYITTQDKGTKSLSFAYANFFGKNSAVITAISARDHFVKACAVSGAFYAMIIPIITVCFLVALIFKLIVPVGVVYFLLRIYGIPVTVKTVIRLCMFASGAFVVSYSVIMLLFPGLMFFANVIHMIAGSLMLMSLVRWNKMKFGAP